MTPNERTALIRYLARRHIDDGQRPTVQSVARYTARNAQVNAWSDTIFSRFAAEVGREVAAQLQEAEDLARVLGNDR